MATVTFDKVTIRYPGAERATVHELDLEGSESTTVGEARQVLYQYLK